MTIAEVIDAANLSQTELSKQFDIPLRTVQDWVSGRRTPPPYVVNLLAQVLGIE